MNDDQMDELLIQAARDYNNPGSVPREEMWRNISAARRLGGSATRRQPRRLWVWPSAGIAAAALLAVGVMLGRRLERQSGTPATVALKPVIVKPRGDSTSSTSAPDSLLKQLHEETVKTDAAARRLAEAPSRSTVQSPDRSLSESPNRPIAQSPNRPDQNLAYRLVVLRHLAGSEALITSFRTEAKHGQMDAQIAQWSREMLGTTRLLEESAAADDPVMKRLLGDLDLIIAQIAVYAARGTNNPEELDLIEQSINQRGVIAKLRSTMPVSPEGSSATRM